MTKFDRSCCGRGRSDRPSPVMIIGSTFVCCITFASFIVFLVSWCEDRCITSAKPDPIHTREATEKHTDPGRYPKLSKSIDRRPHRKLHWLLTSLQLEISRNIGVLNKMDLESIIARGRPAADTELAGSFLAGTVKIMLALRQFAEETGVPWDEVLSLTEKLTEAHSITERGSEKAGLWGPAWRDWLDSLDEV